MISYAAGGDYKGKRLDVSLFKRCAYIVVGFRKKVYINAETVRSYNVLNQQNESSAISGIGRGLVGGAVFGLAGVIGGAMSAKTKGNYMIEINFKNGDRSLIECDNDFYKLIVQACF